MLFTATVDGPLICANTDSYFMIIMTMKSIRVIFFMVRSFELNSLIDKGGGFVCWAEENPVQQ